MLALVLATALAAAPLAQEEPWVDSGPEEAGRKHLLVSVWGGEAFRAGGPGGSSSLVGGEIAWAFSQLDVGVAGYGYRTLPDAARTWSPVALLRLTERFETRRGMEAALTFGLGAGRPDGWEAWFQLALGVRMNLGPLFLGAELGFERNDLLRLAAGVGAAF